MPFLRPIGASPAWPVCVATLLKLDGTVCTNDCAFGIRSADSYDFCDCAEELVEGLQDAHNNLAKLLATLPEKNVKISSAQRPNSDILV